MPHNWKEKERADDGSRYIQSTFPLKCHKKQLRLTRLCTLPFSSSLPLHPLPQLPSKRLVPASPTTHLVSSALTLVMCVSATAGQLLPAASFSWLLLQEALEKERCCSGRRVQILLLDAFCLEQLREGQNMPRAGGGLKLNWWCLGVLKFRLMVRGCIDVQTDGSWMYWSSNWWFVGVKTVSDHKWQVLK